MDVETVLVLPVYFMPNELNVEARSESISEVSEDSHCNHYCHISSFFFFIQFIDLAFMEYLFHLKKVLIQEIV